MKKVVKKSLRLLIKIIFILDKFKFIDETKIKIYDNKTCFYCIKYSKFLKKTILKQMEKLNLIFFVLTVVLKSLKLLIKKR